MLEHEFERKVAEYVKKHHLFASGEHIIVALSGGADSVALLRVLLLLDVKITVLHCNFGLRGDESNRDESFTCDLCSNLGVDFKVKNFNVAEYEQGHKVSTEMACRELRYEWFEAERIMLCADSIAVAHHHDDNVETFFLNILRGSGIQGLAGIRPRNGNVIRPLLCATRDEIESYLKSINQEFVVDSTNLENDFKRNKIRNILIPTINDLFPDAHSGISRTLDNIRSCNNFYQCKVKELQEKVLHVNSYVSVIDLKLLMAENDGAETALFEILKSYGFNSIQVKFIFDSYLQNKMIGQHFYSAEYEAVLGRDKLELFKQVNNSYLGNDLLYVDLFTLLKEDSKQIPLKVRLMSNVKDVLSGVDGRNIIILNKQILSTHPVLTLRKWEQGDRIKPFGMRGSKLISDLFTDAKYLESQKRNTLLLCAGNDVLWVLGLRASRLFSVDKNDDELIRIEYNG